MFWHLQSNSEVSEVLEDSQVPISGVWVSSSHPLKVRLRHWRLLFLFLKRLKDFVLALRKVESFYFCSWRLKVLVFVFREVEGFCCFFWILKVLAHIFGCWRFLFLVLNVEIFFFYFWILKVFTFVIFILYGPNFHYVTIYQHQILYTR